MSEALGTIGSYMLLEKIATGGMAEIFKAKTQGARGFEKIVAIKKILPEFTSDKAFIDMLTDEAKIAVRMNHSNLVQVFDLGEHDRVPFLVMEFVEGMDLKSIIKLLKKREGSIPIPAAIYIVMEVLNGLDFAHSMRDTEGNLLNIVHRDISPGNVLISSSGDVKIIDFGIAKSKGRMTQTQIGSVKGKFRYMSPEQAAGKNVDARTDIFAAALVLYEILVSQRVYEGYKLDDLLSAVAIADIPSMKKFNSAVPDDIEAVFKKATTAQINDRYNSAKEFLLALHNLPYGINPIEIKTYLGTLVKHLRGEGAPPKHLPLQSNQKNSAEVLVPTHAFVSPKTEVSDSSMQSAGTSATNTAGKKYSNVSLEKAVIRQVELNPDRIDYPTIELTSVQKKKS